VVDGGGGPDGGHLDLQPPRLQFPPGQLLEQYPLTLLHHCEKAQQSWEAGHPAFAKHEKTCTAQFAAAVEHDVWSENGGRGLEHQLPHLYSQVGVGVDTIVDVHKDTVLLVVELVEV
jgi:hypothetical protein